MDDGDLERIRRALEEARAVAARYTPGSVEWEQKSGDERWDPLTEADGALEQLREQLAAYKLEVAQTYELDPQFLQRTAVVSSLPFH